MAGTSIEARTSSTIIFILFTILPDKPVNTNTLVSTLCILAGTMVLAGIIQAALINIFQTVATLPVSWALAGIGVDTIHTPPTILAQISTTVIDIFLAVSTLESIWTRAVVLVLSSLGTESTILTGRWTAWNIHTVTILPSPAIFTVALVSTIEVLTATMLTRIAQLKALVHIDIAVWSLEPFLTGALVGVAHRCALCSISAGLVSTVVLFSAVVT